MWVNKEIFEVVFSWKFLKTGRESMRSEIEQIVHILQAVKKINRIIMQSDTIDKGMQSDLLITVEGVNEVLFGNKILVDYKAYELLKNMGMQTITKEQLTDEIAKWCQMVEKKTNDMKDKNNYIDYEFYSLMNYIEMVPEEIILEDMKQNFNKVKQYGEQIYYNFVSFFREYKDFWGDVNPVTGIWDLLYDRLNQLKNHREDFIWLYQELADYRSKMVLNGILQYWVKYDFQIIQKIKENNYTSYFDLDIVTPDDNEVFVDLGAYTGDSAQDFIQNMGAYQRIYCYEISKDVFKQLQENMSFYENITLVNKGVGEAEGIMYLSQSEDASANKITSMGEEAVEIVTLDNDIKEKITFLKMDIEGAEQQAIKGAARHITEEKPKLAICTYHNNYDIWQIPRMLREMNPNYKLYMRYNGNDAEYEFNVTEFVTFAT